MFIGIDIGTQSLKALVCDEALRPLGEAACSYAPDYPRPGWAEQDPRIWEKALKQSVGAALKEAGVQGHQIQALGIAGQLDGCIAVDEKGAALSNCLLWMDRRASLDHLSENDRRDIHEHTGTTPDATHMAAKISWLQKNGFQNAAKFHQPVSYMIARLSGEVCMDHALASTTMIYSLQNRDWDPRLLSLFSINRDQLPALGKAYSQAGTLNAQGAALSGLCEGTPLAVGTGDDFSAPLGAGLIEPGTMACVLGTAEIIGTLSREMKIDSKQLVETHRYFDDLYYIENPGWLSGGVLSWFVKTCRLQSEQELDFLADKVPAGSDGLIFIPAMMGAMSPEWIANARGCFYGLTPAHGTGHMARAILEGTAFAMRDVLERYAEMDLPVTSLRLLGGGAKSRVWAQIRADIAGLPAKIPDRLDTSAMGAAILAAVGVGHYKDLRAASQMLSPRLETFLPAPDTTSVYESQYRRYRTLFSALKPMFTSNQENGHYILNEKKEKAKKR